MVPPWPLAFGRVPSKSRYCSLKVSVASGVFGLASFAAISSADAVASVNFRSATCLLPPSGRPTAYGSTVPGAAGGDPCVRR